MRHEIRMEQRDALSDLIDNILATADIDTISSKCIRESLQQKVDYNLEPQKICADLTSLIKERFDKVEIPCDSPPASPHNNNDNPQVEVGSECVVALQYSPFGRLSAEVRFLIFEKALANPKLLCRPSGGDQIRPPLFATCKAISIEALDAFYASNIFALTRKSAFALIATSPRAHRIRAIGVRDTPYVDGADGLSEVILLANHVQQCCGSLKLLGLPFALQHGSTISTRPFQMGVHRVGVFQAITSHPFRILLYEEAIIQAYRIVQDTRTPVVTPNELFLQFSIMGQQTPKTSEPTVAFVACTVDLLLACLEPPEETANDAEFMEGVRLRTPPLMMDLVTVVVRTLPKDKSRLRVGRYRTSTNDDDMTFLFGLVMQASALASGVIRSLGTD